MQKILFNLKISDSSLHLEPPKSPTRVKISSTWSQRTGDQPQRRVPEMEEDENQEDPSIGAV